MPKMVFWTLLRVKPEIFIYLEVFAGSISNSLIVSVLKKISNVNKKKSKYL